MGTVLAVLAIAAWAGAPSAAQAIGNGEPDAGRHTNVGLLAVEDGGDRYFLCSGWHAGPRKGDPATGVFVTAAHCVADIP